MIVTMGQYVLDLDLERTRAFYAGANAITDGCDCQGCRNFVAWAKLDTEPRRRLEELGITLEKTPEVYVNCANEDGTLFYGGWYHLCGRILRGPEIWEDMGRGSKAIRDEAMVAIGDRFCVGFSESVALLEEHFPTPVIQVELMADIPLILPEPCGYT